MEEEELVLAVKHHPHLYDLSHKKYHDYTVRENTWEEIGNKIGCSAEECKIKWQSLRDCYRKALRKRTKAVKKIKPWRLEMEMEFIKPFICAPKDQTGQITNLDQITNLKPLSDDELEEDLSERSTPQSLVPEDLEFPQMTKWKRKQKITPIISSVKGYFEKDSHPVHLTGYFQSIEETVRMFPPHLQVKVKSQISTIVHNAEHEAIASSQTHFNMTPPPSYSSFPAGFNPIPQHPQTFQSNLPPNVCIYYNAPIPSQNYQTGSTNPSTTIPQPPSSDQQPPFVDFNGEPDIEKIT